MTDTITTEANLAEIGLDLLVPDPKNLRRNVGDIRRLTRSIREVGIYVPLIVRVVEDGSYMVVAGERRLAAARAAGRATVPCVVRSMTEAEVVECMLTENDGEHRQPLTPIEEAAGYLRMAELGCSVRWLAKKVGRPVRHVSARMALLELPDVAQNEVERGTLSLADAEALVTIKDDPDLIAEMLALPAWQRGDFGGRIERRLAEREREAATARAVEELGAAGVRVIGPEEIDWNRIRKLAVLGLDEEAHGQEPCHAVLVEKGWREVRVVAVCTETRRHTARAKRANRSELQVPPSASTGRSAEDDRRAERRRLSKRRSEFLETILARRSLRRVEATGFCLGVLIEEAGEKAKARAGLVLGVEPEVTPWGGKDWTSALVDLAERSAADRLKVAYAVAAACSEVRLASPGYQVAGEHYLRSLEALGYEADASEREVLGGPESVSGDQAGPDAPAVGDRDAVDDEAS